MNRTIKRRLLRLINFWPPFLGAGIRLRRLSPDFREADVELQQRFWNTNYVGVHFGGSLFSMTDAFYMLLLMENLGREYIVWDKSAMVRFRKPGRGTVRAEFRLSEAEIEDVRAAVAENGKCERKFLVKIVDSDGDVVAEVEKLIHVRSKRYVPAPASVQANQPLTQEP
jgi:acyl-coenzyme A thioesterase PaaI-like protein